MKEFVKRMVEEHSQLVVRIDALEKFIYSYKSDPVDKVPFSNMCIQLKAMRVYAEALGARLANNNVVFENGQYFEKVAQINKPVDINVIKGTSNVTSNDDVTTEKSNE